MAERQGATPPTWMGRSRWRLLLDALGGWRQNVDKLIQLVGLLLGYVRPALVRRRLQRLQALGHLEASGAPLPTLPQLLVAARDQMVVSATEETRLFYRSQGIPWVFHNLRRFVSGPATMLDPMGLFSPRETIVHHVLQTFHRHPVYDLVLLRAHPGRTGIAGGADRRAAGRPPPAPAGAVVPDRRRVVPRPPAGGDRRLRRQSAAAGPAHPTGSAARAEADAGDGPVQGHPRLRRLRRPAARRVGDGDRRLAGRGLRRDRGQLAGDQARPAPGGAGRL